jgi:hypothetical protein
MSTATIAATALLALPLVPEVGAATSEVRPVGDFQPVEFRGAGHLLTSVRNGVLIIEQKDDLWRSGDAELTVDIHLPSLARLTVKGAVVADVSGLNGGRTVLVMPARTPLAASRDSVGSLTSAERMDHRMQSTIGGSRILR